MERWHKGTDPSCPLLLFSLLLPRVAAMPVEHLGSAQQREADRCCEPSPQPALCPFLCNSSQLAGAKGLLGFLHPILQLLPQLLEGGCPRPLLTVSCSLVTTWQPQNSET